MFVLFHTVKTVVTSCYAADWKKYFQKPSKCYKQKIQCLNLSKLRNSFLLHIFSRVKIPKNTKIIRWEI